MFTVENLTVSFGRTLAVHEVSLHAAAGAVTGILGANGSGKTTTLLGILARVPRAGGRILLDGEDVTDLDTAALVRAGVALCPENRRLFPSMSIEDNLLLGAHDRKLRKEVLARMYDRFDWIHRRRADLAGSLSGGQQQTVAIARALMSEPRLVLLDEPSSGLSPVAVKEISCLLAEIARDGAAVLLVEQNVRLVEDLCATAWVLAHGEVAAKGAVTDLMAGLSETYLGTGAS